MTDTPAPAPTEPTIKVDAEMHDALTDALLAGGEVLHEGKFIPGTKYLAMQKAEPTDEALIRDLVHEIGNAASDEVDALCARLAELRQELVAHDHTIEEIGERAARMKARAKAAEAALAECRAALQLADNALQDCGVPVSRYDVVAIRRALAKEAKT